MGFVSSLLHNTGKDGSSGDLKQELDFDVYTHYDPDAASKKSTKYLELDNVGASGCLCSALKI